MKYLKACLAQHHPIQEPKFSQKFLVKTIYLLGSLQAYWEKKIVHQRQRLCHRQVLL